MKKYNDEFKREVLAYYEKKGCNKTVKKFKVSTQTIYTWKKAKIRPQGINTAAGIELMHGLSEHWDKAQHFYEEEKKIIVYKSDHEKLEKENRRLKDYIINKLLEV